MNKHQHLASHTLSQRCLWGMNESTHRIRGISLIQVILTMVAGTLLLTAILNFMQWLSAHSREQFIEHQGIRYPVAPSMSAGVQASRYHLQLTAVRGNSDMVFAFGGRIHIPLKGGEWRSFGAAPLRMDCDWHELAEHLSSESNDDWFRRLAYRGGNGFFEFPYPLLSVTDQEENITDGSYTLLFLKGRKLSGVVQVRRQQIVQETDQVPWAVWDCYLICGEDLSDEYVYRCAWQKDEMPLQAVDGAVSPFSAIKGRYPGLLQVWVPHGIAYDSHLTFAEAVFPDPMLLWSASYQDGNRYPISKYFHLFLFK